MVKVSGIGRYNPIHIYCYTNIYNVIIYICYQARLQDAEGGLEDRLVGAKCTVTTPESPRCCAGRRTLNAEHHSSGCQVAGKFILGWDVVHVVQRAHSLNECLLCSFFEKTWGNDVEYVVNRNTSW